eukprot:6828820-Pyramimonas_sp.AAC.2
METRGDQEWRPGISPVTVPSLHHRRTVTRQTAAVAGVASPPLRPRWTTVASPLTVAYSRVQVGEQPAAVLERQLVDFLRLDPERNGIFAAPLAASSLSSLSSLAHCGVAAYRWASSPRRYWSTNWRTCCDWTPSRAART